MSSCSTYSNFYNFRDINNNIQKLATDINDLQTKVVQDGVSVSTLTVDSSLNITGDTNITGSMTVDNSNGLVVKNGINVNNETFTVSSLNQTIFGLNPDGTRDFIVKKVSSGANHSAVLFQNGYCYLFGNNDNGQVGGVNNAYAPRLLNIPKGSKVTDVACGAYHTAFVIDGYLYTMGHNTYGQLGTGNTTDKNTPTWIPIANSTTVLSVACGGNHTIITYESSIDGETRAMAMGLNINGELGVNSNENKFLSPTHVVVDDGTGTIIQMTNIVKVACGFNHSAFLVNSSSHRTLYTCGNNDSGQLGTSTLTVDDYTHYIIPTPVRVNEDIRDIHCGGATTFMEMNVGAAPKLYSVGLNNYGQLGRATSTPHVFGEVNIVSGYNNMSAGAYHSATFANTYVRLFGHNNYGQLTGDSTLNDVILNRDDVGNDYNTYFANIVFDNRNITHLSCGGNHTIFVLNDKYVFSVGLNSFGQLGIDNQTISKISTPAIVVETDVNMDASVELAGTLTTDGTISVNGLLFVNKEGAYNMNVFDEIIQIKSTIDTMNNTLTTLVSTVEDLSLNVHA